MEPQASAPGHVVVAGATGYVGSAVVAELLRRRRQVVALVRPGRQGIVPEAEGLLVREVAPGLPGSLEQVLANTGVAAVISCIASRTGAPEDAYAVDLDANRRLLTAARAAGAAHFVLLSAICVQKPRLAFQFAKLRFEQELMTAGLRYTIVRPTAYFRSLSGQVDRVRRGKSFLVFGDGSGTACKPIGRGDLARYLVDCLEEPSRHDRILPIGGPGRALTPREQGELLFAAAGREPRFRQVRPEIFRLAEHVLRPMAKLSRRAAAKAEFARIGHYYATESMLVWDPEQGRYDADATPETGSETLRDHYVAVLRDGLAAHAAGAHALFDQSR